MCYELRLRKQGVYKQSKIEQRRSRFEDMAYNQTFWLRFRWVLYLVQINFKKNKKKFFETEKIFGSKIFETS